MVHVSKHTCGTVPVTRVALCQSHVWHCESHSATRHCDHVGPARASSPLPRSGIGASVRDLCGNCQKGTTDARPVPTSPAFDEYIRTDTLRVLGDYDTEFQILHSPSLLNRKIGYNLSFFFRTKTKDRKGMQSRSYNCNNCNYICPGNAGLPRTGDHIFLETFTFHDVSTSCRPRARG